MTKKPILLDIPNQIESERLILRAPHPGEGAMVNAATRESLAELQPWFPWVHPVPAPEDTEEYLRRSAAQWLLREQFSGIIIRKEDEELVGALGLMPRNWDAAYFEIGYWARTSMTGHGYITEAVNAMTAFAFKTLQAQRVEIRCDARNERSAAVARRAGFSYEGRLRNYGRDPQGELFDMIYYSKVRAEFES